jgi:hypothetical protein
MGLEEVSMRTMAAALALALPALSLAEPQGLDRWSKNHPQASRELGEWVKNHPAAAGRFFEWDGAHPARAKEFVTWAIARPAESVDVFVAAHPGWPVFDQIMERHRPAAETFVAWCRRHPPAAEALMTHPGGLHWAGHHLYREYWELKHPMR